MTFSHPWLLVVSIVGTVAFALAYSVSERRRAAQALAYSNLDFVIAATRASEVPMRIVSGAALMAVVLLGIALAGPRFTTPVPVRDAVVMLCIDTSGSMAAGDLAPSRARATQVAVASFIDNVPRGTRIGIVTFASAARLVLSPVDDVDALRDALSRIPPPNGATAIGDALALAGEQLPSQGGRVIVLLTDGVNNRGVDPLETAQKLHDRGIMVSAVGIGSTGSRELIPGTSELADLDELGLRTIAETTGGIYATASDAAALRSAFRDLAGKTVWERRRVDASFGFAFVGGALLATTIVAAAAAGRFP